MKVIYYLLLSLGLFFDLRIIIFGFGPKALLLVLQCKAVGEFDEKDVQRYKWLAGFINNI